MKDLHLTSTGIFWVQEYSVVYYKQWFRSLLPSLAHYITLYEIFKVFWPWPFDFDLFFPYFALYMYLGKKIECMWSQHLDCLNRVFLFSKSMWDIKKGSSFLAVNLSSDIILLSILWRTVSIYLRLGIIDFWTNF